MSKNLYAIGLGAGLLLMVPALSTVYAADMPVKAPPRPVAVMAGWDGFYFGGHIGYGWANDRATNVGTINGPSFPFGTQHTNDPKGLLGGVQAGYNWTLAPNWLIGFEGDFSWANIHRDNDPNPSVVTTAVNFNTEHIKWTATATARLGYEIGASLLYAKGGVAWAKQEVSSNTFSGAGVLTTVTSGETTRTGWTAGGGWEYRIAPNWTVKAEYDYLGFGTKTVPSFVSLGLTAPVLTGVTVLRDRDLQIHEVKVGFNYLTDWKWFGGR